MNIQKYQYVNAYNKYQRPEQLRSDFRHFLAMVERSKINTPAAINWKQHPDLDNNHSESKAGYYLYENDC